MVNIVYIYCTAHWTSAGYLPGLWSSSVLRSAGSWLCRGWDWSDSFYDSI